MEHEAEVAGLAAAGGLSSGDHHPVTTECPNRNSATVLHDRYCPACGQLGADFQRPVFELVTSSLGDMFALDGRLWRTVPALLFRPGWVTRQYLDGKRARFVPPFRLFLLSSLIFFFMVFGVLERQPWMQELRIDPSELSGTQIEANGVKVDLGGEEAAARIEAELSRSDLTPEQRAELSTALTRADAGEMIYHFIREDGSVDREALRTAIAEENADTMTPAQIASAQDMADRVARVYENQELFAGRMKEWAPRFTLLFLPIFAFLLALSYGWHKKKFFYDHLITSLHYQTFVQIMLAVLIGACVIFPPLAGWASLISLVLLYVYLGRLLRVTYRSGHFMSGLRAFILLNAGFLVLSLLAIGLVLLSFFLA
jgi:hypothetical protein